MPTVTYHGDMTGLRVAPGSGHAGRVLVADIGIPSAVAVPAAAWLAGHAAVGRRAAQGGGGDKYAAGAVLVIAGSPWLTGAAGLASSSALRAGAGLVVVATPAAVQLAVAAHLLEVMTAPCPTRTATSLPRRSTRWCPRPAGWPRSRSAPGSAGWHDGRGRADPAAGRASWP